MDEFAPESHAILAIAWPDGGFSATFASGGLSGKASGSPASASGRVQTRVRRRRPAASGDFWRRPAASGSLSQVLSRRPAASGVMNGDYRGQNASLSVIKHNQSALGDKAAT